VNIFSILSIISFLIFLQAGIYASLMDWKSPHVKIFVLLTFLFAIYSGSYALFFNAETIERVYLYDKIAAVGWVFFPLVTVWFFISLTKIKNRVIFLICLLFLIPVSLYSFYVSLTDLESVKLYYEYNGKWFYTPNESRAIYYLFVLYLIVSVLISYFILISWYFTGSSNRQKYQAKGLLFVLSIFFGITFFSNLFLPYIQAHIIPAMAPINALIIVAGISWVLFFVPSGFITPEIVYGLIVNRIKEFLFIADNSGKIQRTNQYTLTNLKYNNYEIARSNLSDIFSDPVKVEDAIRSTKSRSVSRQIRIDLIAKNKELVPVMLYVIKITDHFKRTHGYVLSCMDYRQKLKLRDEVAERVRTEKNLSQIRKELEMLVKRRTQELQEANLRLQQEVVERRSAEEQIKADLQEKITLVQEVHHRVKNNIQIIISLVNMLCSHPKIDHSASEKLRDIAEKVRYISRIHEDFYSSPNLSNIHFSRYLKKAVGELYRNYGRGKEVVFKLNISDQYLDISEAIPLGIVLNELLINSLTHAFENQDMLIEKNTINIEFYRNSQQLTLVISDNGIGFPLPYQDIKTSKVGLQLVNVLVKEHLKGKISHYGQRGTTFMISFTKNQ